MLPSWFNAREAVEAATTLADQFPLQAVSASARSRRAAQRTQGEQLQQFLQRVPGKIQGLRLNFYRRARFANSFRWRLVERGVDAAIADDVTQTLVLHVCAQQANLASGVGPPGVTARPAELGSARTLLSRGDDALARGDRAEAVSCYQQFVALKPGRTDVLNKLGAALCQLGRLKEAEGHFRKAIGREPNDPDAHANLGAVHLSRGLFGAAENSLRRALKLQSGNPHWRCHLGLSLVWLGRLREAAAQFEKVLRVAPRHADALYGMGLIARTEGRFEEAEGLFKRALEIDPAMARAWSALAGLRKMTSSDRAWLQRAREIADGPIAPADEAGLRFAIGKYHDDVGEFRHAFGNYKRANQLLKTVTAPYDREVRTRLVDDLIRVHTPEAIARAKAGACASSRPVLVVGMMRSGTSLAEQIVASHPAVAAMGELEFWNDAMRKHEAEIRRGVLDEPTRARLAEAYLRLTHHSADALRVVDKTPLNSDYLGVIHSVFPNARIIYMRRDPIDTCLSCYFQPFSTALNFTMDLSDLAHYYQEHRRLIAHWRAVLPPGSILDVPYEGLVADQQVWTRRILDFLGLQWDARCLDFHRTKRPVVTASYWQVRQRIHGDSVQRWRNYEKFIGPLLQLQEP